MRPIWQYPNAELSRCNAKINGFMKWNWENRDDDNEESPSTITMSTPKVDDKAGEAGGKGLLPVCPKPRPDPGAAGTPPPAPCRPQPPTFQKKPIREIRKPKASSHYSTLPRILKISSPLFDILHSRLRRQRK
jgi:hypothetical protein